MAHEIADLFEAKRKHLLSLCIAYERAGYNEFDLLIDAHRLFEKLREGFLSGLEHKYQKAYERWLDCGEWKF